MTEQSKQQEQRPEPAQNGQTEEEAGKEALEQIIAEAREEIRIAAGLNKEDWPDERLKVITNIIAPEGTTQQELAAFLGVCDRYKLDPMVGEIWLVYDGKKKKHLIMTGRDSYLAIADRHPDYEGFIHGTVREGDAFEIVREGTEVTVNHILGIERGNRISAYCICYRKGRKAVLISRDWKSYHHLQAKTNWKNNPDDMLETRAITQAHRLQFRIPGIYTPEEITEETVSGTSAADMAKEAVAATRSRMDEMKERFRSEQQTGEGAGEADPITTEELGEINVGALQVEFGQFKKSTWAEVFEVPKGPGYVKHYILEQDYEHPSLTEQVKDGLRTMVAEWEQSREEEASQEVAEEAEEGQQPAEEGKPPEETPQASEDQETDPEDVGIEALYNEAMGIAEQLAKTNDLDPEDAEMLDEFFDDSNEVGVQEVLEKFKKKVAENVENGIDPQLPF